MANYPEQDSRRKVLENLKHRLENSEDYRSLDLFLQVPKDTSEIAEETGLSEQDTARILRTLAREEYIHAEVGNATGLYAFTSVKVYDLLDRGRMEIGDLPDSQEKLIAGFERAVEAIREDPTIPDETKEQKIGGAQHAIAFLRETGSQVAAQIIMGGAG